ncbi:MAG: response regulator [Candidatus Promineifilaceae bacterium]|nr:response regulator [Candidatus Promineifilaceae bacterium]
MDTKQSPEAGELVLVVDDAREIREFLTEYVLEPKGFSVLTAADGLEGLKLAFAERPDLMIVDVEMPNMSGLELLRRLQLRRLEIPAILITAHGSEQVAVQALRLGVRDYVIKPFVVEEMEKAISRALRERRLTAERGQLVEQLKRNNQHLRQRANELNALYGIGKAVSSSLDVETILQRVVEAAVYLARADQGSLILMDEARGKMTIRAAKNAGSQPQSLRQPVQDDAVGKVLRDKQTTILSPQDVPSPGDDPKPNSGAYVPLLVQGRPIGVLRVAKYDGAGAFSKRETRVLSALASFAASAIHNAQLHNRIRKERNLLRALADQNNDPVLLLDDRDRILLANQAARHLLALPDGKVSGQPAANVLQHQELLAFVNQGHEETAATEIELSDAGRYRVRLTPIAEVGRSILLHKKTNAE